jgi:oligopeptide/dipeptide ABC transporter ATP-binding protein
VTPVLSISDLQVSYGTAVAVRRASLTVEAGQALALIGETGSGKTSVAHSVVGLLPTNARAVGSITVAGQPVLGLGRRELRSIRGSVMSFIPQDAMAALNPVLTVRLQVAEIFETHQGSSRAKARSQAVEALARVRLQDSETVGRLYPHQLSGGMRQRVMIAMALALEPALIVADEPTTALDVSTQAEILALIQELRTELGTAILWITHDMGVVAELADTVAVMYAGRIVEVGSSGIMLAAPRHPYTRALLRTREDLHSGQPGDPLYQIRGLPPSPLSGLSGCWFHPRCEFADQICREVDPELATIDGLLVACHHPRSVTVARSAS